LNNLTGLFPLKLKWRASLILNLSDSNPVEEDGRDYAPWRKMVDARLRRKEIRVLMSPFERVGKCGEVGLPLCLNLLYGSRITPTANSHAGSNPVGAKGA